MGPPPPVWAFLGERGSDVGSAGQQQYGVGTPAPGLHSAEDRAAAPPGLPLGITTLASHHAGPEAQGSSLQTCVWPGLARRPEDSAGGLPDPREPTRMGAEDQVCVLTFPKQEPGLVSSP